MEQRELSADDTNIRKFVELYNDLEKFLKRVQFRDDLKEELEQSHPGFLTVIRKWRSDLEKSDHGIVIAGETSSGKSTLMNKILKKRIFKSRNLESTSTICKIRNSDRTKVIIVNKDSERSEEDLTGECDITTKEGVKKLRQRLKRYTDKTCSDESATFKSVEITFPIPFLKGNAILVDTPGIGGKGELSEKVMDYLSNAVAFIFVIKVSSAGGLQSDRLPLIFKKLSNLQLETEMPCFDPNNVIFITTHWDVLKRNSAGSSSSDVDSSDEDEEMKTWNSMILDITKCWPSVKEEQIFRINLNEVDKKKREKTNASTEEFCKFRNMLDVLIEKAQNIRFLQHCGFIEDILSAISNGLHARIEFSKKNKKQQTKMIESHQEKIAFLTVECEKGRTNFREKTKQTIDGIAQKCFEYMSSNDGKERILNPPLKKPISEFDLFSDSTKEEIMNRVTEYIEHYLKSDEVLAKFENIRREFNSFSEKISLNISEMEKEWTNHPSGPTIAVEKDSSISFLLYGIITSPFFLTMIAFGVSFPTAILAYGSFILSSAVGWFWKTAINIDKQYDYCLILVKDKVNEHLQENCADVIYKMVDKVTVVVLPKRINSLNKRIKQALRSIDKFVADQELLTNLAGEVKVMQRSLAQLEDISES